MSKHRPPLYVSRKLSGHYAVGRWLRGRWRLESEHVTAAVAADRAAYMNGGRVPA